LNAAPLLRCGHLNFKGGKGKVNKSKFLAKGKNGLLVMGLMTAVVLMPVASYGQTEVKNGSFPPISQSLVREGDFAVQLVPALQLGEAQDEGEAEGILVNAGIEPRNGWLPDYPMTPQIVGQLEKSAAAAADSGQLAVEKDEAVQAVEDVAANLGLPVLTGTDNSGEYAGNTPPGNEGGEYPNPSEVGNYYSQNGPPVITYYSPPPEYVYLYAWVVYPFWCDRVFFPGFFILHNFHRQIIRHHRAFVVTNHFFNPATGGVVVITPESRIGPPKRAFRGPFQGNRIPLHGGFISPRVHGGAREFREPHHEGQITPRGTFGVPPGFSGRGAGGGPFQGGGFSCMGRC
jgi:hypothetical protein